MVTAPLLHHAHTRAAFHAIHAICKVGIYNRAYDPMHR